MKPIITITTYIILLQPCFTQTLKHDKFRQTYDHIVRLNPHLPIMRVSKIARAIQIASKAYHLPPDLLVALIMTESSFQLNAINNNIDYGLFQINIYNIKRLKLDKQKLLTDINYSVDTGARVFKWFYDTYGLKHGIQRFNCGTRPSCVNNEKSITYLNRVLNYIKK